MKCQYLVCEEYTPGSATYSNIGRVVKKFKHENDAVNFMEEDKNLQQYYGLSLYRKDDAGHMFRWDGRGSWEVCSCE